MIPEYIINEPEDQYHAQSKSGQYMSSHMLAAFRKCPHLYWKKIKGLINEDERPAYLIGRAAHCLILEGRARFNESFAVGGPINPKTGKPYGSTTQAFADWAAEIGKPVITDADLYSIEMLNASVRNHFFAVHLLSNGFAEGVCRAQYQDVNCQIRMDWFNPDMGIVDLKTCDDLTWFEADAKRYGYHNQLAFYQSVLEVVSGKKHPVYIIAVEKKEPHRTAAFLINPETLDFARSDNEITMELFRNCKEKDSWPTGYESLRMLN